jgi:DNA repair exonuclease SbcCD ATPase subunit
MKVHLAVTCTLILVGIIAMMRSSDPSAPSDNSYETSTASAPATMPVTGGNTTDNRTPGSGEPAKTSPSATASNETPSDKVEDNRLAVREQHRQHLEKQLKVWKTAIQAAKAEIASDDKAIDEQRSALESLKAKIDGMNPDTQVQQEVDDYNALVQSYESQRRDFNAHVERHNSKLEASREAVRRHNAIVDELNKDR